jgi:hypothetical protein
LLLLLGAAILLGTFSCRKAAPPEEDEPAEENEAVIQLPDIFEEVARDAGIHFTYRDGQEAGHYSILESLGGGVALIDYDGDGLLDIFITGGGYFAGKDNKEIRGHLCKLYKNLGRWKFKDVTREVGLDGPVYYTHGAAVADYDRDGWPDLLVTGYGRVTLYHNEPVDPDDPKKGRKFRDVTREAGLLEREHFWSTSAAFADLDGDGYPDLYLCQYVNWSFRNHPRCGGYKSGVAQDVCPPREFEAVPHVVYHNVPDPGGRRRFVDVSKAAGLRTYREEKDFAELTHLGAKVKNTLRQAQQDRDFGKGLGVVVVDVNGDRRPDIYVANDTTDNFLYLNRSRPGRILLEEVGFGLGVARDGNGVTNGSMGADAADYDGSGRASLWVTNYEGELHALYRNLKGERGTPRFLYSTPDAGIAAIGNLYVGFGTGFVDLDNHGWEDLVISNGHVVRHPHEARHRQRPVLLRNLGTGRFADMTACGGPYFRTDHLGRGLAVGDLDNDGLPDLVVSHVNDPVALLRNRDRQGHHWLGIELAARGHADVAGARLTLEVAGRTLTRFGKGGGSYLSSGDRRFLFGLGKAGKAGKLTVEWPSGQPAAQTWEGLRVDRYHRLTQGEAKSRVLEPRP